MQPRGFLTELEYVKDSLHFALDSLGTCTARAIFTACMGAPSPDKKSLFSWRRAGIPESSKCMEVFADLGFRQNFQISLLKMAFGGIPSLRQNWLLNACPSKVQKNVGRFWRNCPQFRRNCPQFRQNYPDSALVTNMHSPWKHHFGRIENCRQFYLFSAEILEFGDSCAEM